MQRTFIAETIDKIGETVSIFAWVDSKRDHGKVTFVDFRDKSGKIQAVGINDKLKDLTVESVVKVTGQINARPEKLINSNLITGKVELFVEDYQILNKAVDLPILIDGDGLEINEEVRLKYRYLDLRRERLQKTIRMRSRLNQAFREALLAKDFVEIETPMLTKSTEEGARDFVVPSRYNPGKFYALPQSPQQYKQLLMTAGFERYFQFARCIRDEDLRADRGYEFTQLDLEMSFVEQETIMKIFEEMLISAVKAVGGKLQKEVFPIISYQQAMEKYGADKFDLRSNQEKEEGLLAFAWVINYPFFKSVDQTDQLEKENVKGAWTFTHNPFSNPIAEHIAAHKAGISPEKIIAAQYDLVCNGHEVAGGSIRAHDPEVLRASYRTMGYSDQEIEESVGHMLKAFTLGTPPHGGIALGMDRLVMLLAGEKSLKETVAFPMTASGKTAAMDAPSTISKKQLKELSLQIEEKKN